MTETSLRASDLDRQHIVEVLQEHTVAGRLSLDEFSERVTRAYAATTRGELDALVADLPAAPSGVEQTSSGAASAAPLVPSLDRDTGATWMVSAPLVCLLTVLVGIGLLVGSPAALAVVVLAGFAVWRWSPGGLAAVGRRLGPPAPEERAGHHIGQTAGGRRLV